MGKPRHPGSKIASKRKGTYTRGEKKAVLRRLVETKHGKVRIFPNPKDPLSIEAKYLDNKGNEHEAAYISGAMVPEEARAVGIDMFTKPEFRDSKVTTTMIKLFERQAKRLGAKIVELKAVKKEGTDKVEGRDTTPLLRKLGYVISIPKGQYIGKGTKVLK